MRQIRVMIVSHQKPWAAIISMRRGVRRAFLFSLSAIATACGASPAHPEPPQEKAGGPLIHRFEHAEQWAREFDDPARDAWQRPRDIIAAMQIEPDMVVADIGAGTGYFEPWLSRAVGSKGTVLALDVEPDMVRYLGERAQREHLDNVRPALVSADDPRLPPGGVDRILIVDTWHHIASRDGYAAKLREALKSGGRVFVVDFKLDAKHGPPPHHRLSSDRVAGELTSGGLSTEVSETALPEQYVVVGTRR